MRSVVINEAQQLQKSPKTVYYFIMELSYSLENQLISIKNWLLRYIQVQLFITIVTLPLLVYWGLPLSFMSPVSNLIFAPLLMLFLLISSLIFFTQILSLPNLLLITGLEQLTNFWNSILNYGAPSWLISFATPPKYVFFILIIVAFAVLQSRSLSSPARSSICFALLLIITFGYLKYQKPTESTIKHVACNNGQLPIVRSNKQTVIIDPGLLGRRFSTVSWIEYTLIPALNKQFGTAIIDHLIIMQPNKLVFEAIEKLCQCTMVKNVHLIAWHGQTDKWLMRKYSSLRRVLDTQQNQLKRIGYKKEIIQLSKTDQLIIQPLNKKLTYQDITFPALHISGIAAHQIIDIYSMKYKAIDMK
jgi:hypothetical protein